MLKKAADKGELDRGAADVHGWLRVTFESLEPQDLAESFSKTYRGMIEASQFAGCFLGMLSVAFVLVGMLEVWQK